MNKKYGANTCLDGPNICRFNEPCSETKKGAFGKDTDIEFKIHDVLKDYIYKIRTESMMVDGKWFSDPGSCWIPIFKHGLK